MDIEVDHSNSSVHLNIEVHHSNDAIASKTDHPNVISVSKSKRKVLALITPHRDRDVFCIPESVRKKSAGGNIRYPWGKYRAELARCGLIGKLHMTSEMTAEEVSAEVHSVFKEPMGNNPNFPFLYLQPTGGGSKSLTVPSQSSSFTWTAQQVARLGGQS